MFKKESNFAFIDSQNFNLEENWSTKKEALTFGRNLRCGLSS